MILGLFIGVNLGFVLGSYYGGWAVTRRLYEAARARGRLP